MNSLLSGGSLSASSRPSKVDPKHVFSGNEVIGLFQCQAGRPRTWRVSAFKHHARKQKYELARQMEHNNKCQVVTVEPDGSDLWRLEPVYEWLKNGAVGIIPTDTCPALVAPLQDRDAVTRLYRANELDPKKPLSILVRGFHDLAHYTAGFPAPQLGHPNWFNIMKRLLPGPYTLILPASKNLPSQCVDFMRSKTLHRKSVGVRMPGHRITQAVLEGAGMALLVASVHSRGKELATGAEVPDVGSMMEEYAGKGVEFIVDMGPHAASHTSVIDMTGATPEITRVGLGDVTPFQQ